MAVSVKDADSAAEILQAKYYALQRRLQAKTLSLVKIRAEFGLFGVHLPCRVQQQQQKINKKHFIFFFTKNNLRIKSKTFKIKKSKISRQSFRTCVRSLIYIQRGIQNLSSRFVVFSLFLSLKNFLIFYFGFNQQQITRKKNTTKLIYNNTNE